MDRQTLPEGNNTADEQHMDIFDDEFEVPDFDIPVSDGFRPLQPDDRPVSPLQQRTPSPPIVSAAPHVSETPVTPPRSPVRSSIQKPSLRPNPFASPEDDTADEATPSLSFEPDSSAAARLSISSVSSHMFARTASVRLGEGPSHPYGMYTQGTLARSSSSGTTSTVRAATQGSSSQGGPQHPYSLYPQGVEDDMEDEITQVPVPVGFPGLGGQSYQRRLGPDGEDQDLIGADGHTEQLPPYTRYPEDGPEKMPLLGIPEAPTALHSRAPVAGTDPTMPLMHTPLQTPSSRPQSMMDQSAIVSSPFSRGHAGDSQSELISTRSWNEKTWMDKSWKEKSWKEKSKTRFCGCIPLWVFMLMLGVIVFIGSVLGGVLGGWVAGIKHRKYSGPSDGFFDAKTIMPTPSDMSVPTGTFALSLSTPTAVYKDCLPANPDNAAWTCNLAGPPGTLITVSTGMGQDNKTLGASITYGADIGQPPAFFYGEQASWLNSTWSRFQVVQDLDSPNDGPAYYFQQTFDKLVVLGSDALQAGPNIAPRHIRRDFRITLDSEWFKRKQYAKIGDKPWFCVWKNTVMEGFIYPRVNAVSVAYGGNASATTKTVVSITPSTMAPATTPPPPSASHPPETVQNFYTKAVFPGGTQEQFEEWYKQNMLSRPKSFKQHHYDGGQQGDDDDDDQPGPLSTTPPPPPPPPLTPLPPGPHKRQDQGQPMPPPFPYVVKLEERRTDGNSAQPYCEQWQILENGELGPLSDPPPTVLLHEDDPLLSEYQNGIAGDADKFDKHTCHCQWVSGRN